MIGGGGIGGIDKGYAGAGFPLRRREGGRRITQKWEIFGGLRLEAFPQP